MALLSRRVRMEDWEPIGVDELEANALDVVSSTGNRSVIAGPGSGKTELLAQRAAYLLQTGISAAPQRILAICFKRDAATNLGARVRQRCHREHGHRFDSLTFDAFAKGLVDRFGQALPERWRPDPDYEIMQTNERLYRGFLEQIGDPPSAVGRRAGIRAIRVKEFERNDLLGQPLPIDGWQRPTPGQWAAERFWHSSLHEGNKTHLSFPMISRLAELLLRVNPQASAAIRITYSHLFMDEFQDTTQVQYDLVRAIFLESDTIITAVGDVKQQIMRWANAMEDPFGAFEAEFEAKRTPLFNNYRSSPELVRIQHVLAQALDAGSLKPVSKAPGTVDGDSCSIWDFSSPEKEAEYLATYISDQMRVQDLTPRDFVLLVRQKAVDYAKVLGPAFAEKGLPLRNEAAQVGSVILQELLVEEVSEILVLILRLATNDHARRYWSDCQQMLAVLHGVAADEDVAQARLSRNLDRFARELRDAHPDPIRDADAAQALVGSILEFVGRDRLMAAHPAYSQGDWLERLIEAATKHLQASGDRAADWAEALDAYEGTRALPLMTIHKSKGLEYHTVVFIGLDDGAWWSFADDKVEGTAGFFVAFTRAKQRVVFTYCASRGNRKKIATLYGLLQLAGVKAIGVA